eukprot:CAMPEP_0170592288 /NCGR_PEP_ID=MMETSP0224-20130122/12847_1 /TAXON_ID=285029 /ORGANISM="Togula jolla, Strain CCCM 725" /LENGTH=99 /DNA_ID=CAMNT_0010916189 /DNA_START=45 /DNA_END=344 /DNA_ORIENTATION=-
MIGFRCILALMVAALAAAGDLRAAPASQALEQQPEQTELLQGASAADMNDEQTKWADKHYKADDPVNPIIAFGAMLLAPILGLPCMICCKSGTMKPLLK